MAAGPTARLKEHRTNKETEMFKGKKTAKVKDPVCGMSIDPHRAAAQVVHEGQTYFFCSLSCRDQFVADPKAYL